MCRCVKELTEPGREGRRRVGFFPERGVIVFRSPGWVGKRSLEKRGFVWKGIDRTGMVNNSLEWQSIMEALREIPVERVRAVLGEKGTLAYTDGACIKNPGGPAGWCTILVSVDAVANEEILPQAE